ncbi:MAG: hypothetical protein BWY09_03056 [Candidatus Hydrogenedentes bacterium ADurb.Bin179]|nr:MAG: hypothetical protein BWY09_03056 [Candidatus Hydrogenedentes bacterium ADurb.Bin179]
MNLKSINFMDFSFTSCITSLGLSALCIALFLLCSYTL